MLSNIRTIKDLAEVPIQQVGQSFIIVCATIRQSVGVMGQPQATDCMRRKCREVCPFTIEDGED